MKNVTVTLEEEVARWARIRAATRDMSMSRMLGEMLREQMRAEAGYEAAMQEYLGRRPRKLRRDPTRYPGRDTLHER